MSDLLVGCRVIIDGEGEGIIVKWDRGPQNDKILWVLFSDGQLFGKQAEHSSIRIHPDDVKFIVALNKNYKLREKILSRTTNRLNILDL